MRALLCWSVVFGLPLVLAHAACTTEAVSEDDDEEVADKPDLPCEVAAVVETHCLRCHGSPLRSGAPQSLLTVAEWKAPAPGYPTQTNGQMAQVRMSNSMSPMPPEGGMTAEEIATIVDWVNAGYPGGDCKPATPADPPLDAASTCTSGDMWPAPAHYALGKDESEMFPGMPCIDCHTNPSAYGQPESGPSFAVAGTVFPTGHEPDNCAGVDNAITPDVFVRIEDANGTVWDLPLNPAGNFFQQVGVVPPYSAKVLSNDGVRAMSYRPTSGDCNGCHTEAGSNGGNPEAPTAPGRIVVPAPPM